MEDRWELYDKSIPYYRFLSNNRLWKQIGKEMHTSGKFEFVIYEIAFFKTFIIIIIIKERFTEEDGWRFAIDSVEKLGRI